MLKADKQPMYSTQGMVIKKLILKKEESLHWKQHSTTSSVLQPIYRSICVSWHLQLKTGGFD